MATEKLSEQEIQLRKRARRRLVGAVALVLLMVTVLPMVLDDREAQSPQPEIAVNIPSQDNGDFASRIVPVEPAPNDTAAPNQSQQTPVETAPSQPAPVAEPKAEPVKADPEAAPTPAPAPVAQPQPEPPKPVAPVEKKTVQPEKKVAAGDGYTVQIGVFSDAGNVKQLQDKLAAAGFKSYTEKLGLPGGTKIRLRVGSYSDRAEAEKALAKLKAAGTDGMVVSK